MSKVTIRKIDELKAIVKDKAAAIKKGRAELKTMQRKGKVEACWTMSGLRELSWDYRHYHIAYSELRGRTRDQIEKPREDNKAWESYINKIKTQYAWEVPVPEAQEIQETK